MNLQEEDDSVFKQSKIVLILAILVKFHYQMGHLKLCIRSNLIL